MSLASNYFKERLGYKCFECDEGYISYKYMTYEGIKGIYYRDAYVVPEGRRNHILYSMAEELKDIALSDECKVALSTINLNIMDPENSMRALLWWGMKPVAYMSNLLWFMKKIDKDFESPLLSPRIGIPFAKDRSLYGNYIGEIFGDRIIELDEGFITYNMLPYNKEKSCYIKEIYVDPKCRSKGIAHTLGDRVTDIAKSDGCVRLVGSIDNGSNGKDYALKAFMYWGFRLDKIEGNILWIIKDL